ncbi:MerR family transcriptional regulator [Avibacterium paragallinarum]|uniref:MerR family transcriptional regulator n=1 Tax=Avibacterium paragallinarum TaxID=728 RepID=UPI0039858B2A
MKINQFSQRSGVHLETIRFYEKKGLLPTPKRDANGYRQYDEDDLNVLQFIKICRTLDFSLEEIKQLNHLRHQPAEHHHLDQIMQKQLEKIEEKIVQLIEMRDFLQTLTQQGEHSESECQTIARLRQLP